MKHLPSQLVQAWNRWFRVMEDVALGHVVERRLSPQQYQEWHRQLIELCNRNGVHPFRQSAKTAREMAEFAQPWNSLETLKNADPEILLRAVAQAETQFHGRIQKRGLVLSARRLFWMIGALVMVGGVATYYYDHTIIESIPAFLRSSFRAMTRFARREREQFYGITILVVILGGIILYSTKKS